jgi:hypothetical protein
MALQITVTFPCSDEEYKKSLIILAAMHKSDFKRPAPVMKASKKNEDIFSMLTEDEERILEARLHAAHKGEGTPMLDDIHAAGICKPVFSDEIVKFFKKNPGSTSKECAESLANKFVEYFPSYETAVRRFKCNIGTVTSQKKLVNTQNAGGRRGGKIYVVEPKKQHASH